jgi:transcription initiation factor TFIID subunit 7
MEQYVLRLPEKLATVVRERLSAQEMGDMHYEATGDFNGKGFTFHIGGVSYPATLGNLPCVVETHKSFDKHTYFKTGEVGQVGRNHIQVTSLAKLTRISLLQMLMVHETEDEARQFREPMVRAESKKSDKLDKDGNLFSGLTPPTAGILNRKFKQVYKFGYPGSYKPEDVSRVEAELADQSGIHEELVDFEDYMVAQGKGLKIDVDSDAGRELIRKHPEIMMTGEHREEFLSNGKLTQAQAKKALRIENRGVESESGGRSKKRARNSMGGGGGGSRAEEPEEEPDQVSQEDVWAEIGNEVGVDEDEDEDEQDDAEDAAASAAAAAFARYPSHMITATHRVTYRQASMV